MSASQANTYCDSDHFRRTERTRKLGVRMKTIDRATFYREYAERFGGVLTPLAAAGIERLLASLEADPAVDDVRWAAYMLATIKHECADEWLPITERGATRYFDKYNAGTKLGKRLGNTQPGDGFRYRGRGFVQITGRNNYARLSQLLHRDQRLIDQPEHALDHDTAYAIMSIGMLRGVFTGKKLADHIAGDKCDYVNARRIINGLDKAERIAEHARRLEQCLRTALAAVVPAAVPASDAPAVDATTPPAPTA
jgi:putative chitinase